MMTIQQQTFTMQSNIGVATRKKIEYRTLIYIKSDINYCSLFFLHKRSIIISRSLKRISELPELNHWLRIHQSYLVNPNFIIEISFKAYYLKMQSGDILPISRRRINSVLKFIQEVSTSKNILLLPKNS
jgi:two-component system LytT family response regulator